MRRRRAADDVTVGAGIIGGPAGAALLIAASVAAVAAAAEASAVQGSAVLGVHQAGEGPFGFFLVIGRERKIFVFAAGIFAERSELRFPGERGPNQHKRRGCGNESGAMAHNTARLLFRVSRVGRGRLYRNVSRDFKEQTGGSAARISSLKK